MDLRVAITNHHFLAIYPTLLTVDDINRRSHEDFVNLLKLLVAFKEIRYHRLPSEDVLIALLHRTYQDYPAFMTLAIHYALRAGPRTWKTIIEQTPYVGFYTITRHEWDRDSTIYLDSIAELRQFINRIGLSMPFHIKIRSREDFCDLCRFRRHAFDGLRNITIHLDRIEPWQHEIFAYFCRVVLTTAPEPCGLPIGRLDWDLLMSIFHDRELDNCDQSALVYLYAKRIGDIDVLAANPEPPINEETPEEVTTRIIRNDDGHYSGHFLQYESQDYVNFGRLLPLSMQTYVDYHAQKRPYLAYVALPYDYKTASTTLKKLYLNMVKQSTMRAFLGCLLNMPYTVPNNNIVFHYPPLAIMDEIMSEKFAKFRFVIQQTIQPRWFMTGHTDNVNRCFYWYTMTVLYSDDYFRCIEPNSPVGRLLRALVRLPLECRKNIVRVAAPNLNFASIDQMFERFLRFNSAMLFNA